MTASYEDYEQEYKAHLARIRSFLAGTRSQSTLTECDRLLHEAKRCATAMQGLAEVEGNALRLTEAKNFLQRDITPLTREVQRALHEMGGGRAAGQRDELFSGYQAPDIEIGDDNQMDSLIQSSEDLLRESQAILSETEYIGTSTIHHMGRQREQLEQANRHVDAVRAVAVQAKNILSSMSRRAWKNKVFLYALITVLAAANLYVLYQIYVQHHQKKN